MPPKFKVHTNIRYTICKIGRPVCVRRRRLVWLVLNSIVAFLPPLGESAAVATTVPVPVPVPVPTRHIGDEASIKYSTQTCYCTCARSGQTSTRPARSSRRAHSEIDSQVCMSVKFSCRHSLAKRVLQRRHMCNALYGLHVWLSSVYYQLPFRLFTALE